MRSHPASSLVCALPLFACIGCADWARPTIFPQGAAQQPVVQEQALLGLDADGNAAVAQLIVADGGVPRLALLRFDHATSIAGPLKLAPPEIAQAVSRRLVAEGGKGDALLGPATAELWPAALTLASGLGFAFVACAVPEPERSRYALTGAPPARLSLSLRLAESTGPRMQELLIGELPGGQASGDEVTLARMPLSGRAIEPRIWIGAQTVWMLAGSVRGGEGSEPLHRTIGLRGASLRRGEAEIHNGHGLADYSAGELDSARREFDRALAADPRFLDALYNAAAVAALSDRADDAIGLLRRAVLIDARRVQVLGRDDDDLRVLRQRPEVRALLGLLRPSIADSAPPSR